MVTYNRPTGTTVMPSRDGAGSPRQLLALFLGTTLVLLTALGWLGWQSLQQDRSIEAQQVNDRVNTAADLIAAQIRQNLTDVEAELGRLSMLPADGLKRGAENYSKALGGDALVVVFEGQRVFAYPADRLLYYPTLPNPIEAPPDRFAVGETLELRDRDYRGAAAHFTKLAQSGDHEVSAGALIRLARNQRKAGDNDAALATYARLATINDAYLFGWPSDLRARKTRCDLLDQLGRQPELLAEARQLNDDLHSAKWMLTRATFMYVASEVRRWLGASNPTVPHGVALALAANVDTLWERWQRDPAGMLGTQGSVVSRDQSTALSRGTPNRVVAVVSGPLFLDHHVVAPLRELLDRYGVGLTLADGEGRMLFAHNITTAGDARPVMRTMDETRLPWTLLVVSADPAADLAGLAARRSLLIGGLVLMALLAMAGSYFSVRAMTREIKAARLQSEFVAAVSHEFRTPLTSLRQFTDLLADGRVSDEADRHQYYEVLQRGTRRLTRLVENLLDFGRMEAGFYRFMLEPVRAHDVLSRVTAEFVEEMKPRGYSVEVQWSGSHEGLIDADEATLGRAIWNLMDNAVKYSPDCRTIWVRGSSGDGAVTISIRDQGIGIAAPEQRTIFGKFVRGTLPAGSTIKGTGLGLALVDQIVRGHGGHVRVESAVGEGSTFSIILPMQRSQPAARPEPTTVEAPS